LIISKVIISAAIISTAFLAVIFKKIDLNGALVGISLAFVIWIGTGEVALLSLFTFFIIGTLASSWKKDAKARLRLDQEYDGKRGIQNVLANGGTAGILSFLAFIIPEYHHILFIMAITSFAAACSDTLSSELGNVYGRKYFNIITLKPAQRGIDGGVSLEGFGFGIFGSLIIALLPVLFQADLKVFVIIAISGFLGNIIDSILGATLQQKGKLSNHEVNFWATLIASLISLGLILLFKI